MDRPLKLPYGRAFGALALVLTVFFVGLYLPGAPSALAWPFEWGIILFWAVLGAVLYALSGSSSEQPTPASQEAEG